MSKKLLDRFDKLSSGEQDILLALSVIYVPIGQTRLLQLLKQSNCLATGVWQIIAKPLREKLLSLELIETSNDGWICPREISEVLMKKAVDDKALFFEKLAREVINDTAGYPYRGVHMKSIKILRIYLYQGHEQAFLEKLEEFEQEHFSYLAETLELIFFQDFNATWFANFSIPLRMKVLQSYQMFMRLGLDGCGLQYQLMNACFSEAKSLPIQLLYPYIELHLIRGDIAGMEALLEGDKNIQAFLLMGMLRFMQGRIDDALPYYNTAIKLIKKHTRKRNIYLDEFPGCFYNLALLQGQVPENLATLIKHLKIAIKQRHWHDPFQLAEQRLLSGLDVYQAKSKASDGKNQELFQHHEIAYDQLFQLLLLYWLGEIETLKTLEPNYTKALNQFCQQADANDYFWFAAVSANLLKRLEADNKTTGKIAEKYSDSSFNTIIDLLPHVESWQRALHALTRLGGGENLKSDAITTQNELRMIWTLDLEDQQAYLSPREQRLGKNGRWSKGRPVAVKRLHQDLEDFPYLSEHDRRICSRIEVDYEDEYYGYHRREIYLLSSGAVIEAIGHPNVYWQDVDGFDRPVNITKAELQLLVSERKSKLLISLSPMPEIDEKYIAERTASDDLLVYQVEPQHHQVAEILGEKGLTVPKQAKQQVLDSISSIASMLTIQSDIGGQSSSAEMVIADSRLHVHLQPVGEGIQIDVFVQPFANGGPIYKPGAGGSTVLAEIGGQQLQTLRDFTQELKALEQLIDNCPGLYHSTDAKWLLDDTEMALEVLLELQALDDFAVLEWPKGKAIKINRETGLEQVQFSVRKEKDWFTVSGEVQVDDGQVMEMQKLMGLLAATPGRFLKLEDGQIIALTQDLRQRLDDFSGLGEAFGDNLRFHPLAAQALDDISEGMVVKASKHWQAQLTRLAEMADLDPQLPSTLQGELRDYQIQGFQWLVRLAHMGAGACLADDMGLGKTIQALALILTRATDGPTLILAPVSVCNNWLEEAQRFAPTLNINYFGIGDRQQQLDDAGAFDVVVCSYGLLQTEASKLIEKSWHTIVADEAQAIKNPQTKRSKAAMALQGDFKIITTGTPIENHLGELWSLFNFINPGLLGSLKKFNERYAQKIENDKDHGTQQRLKKLLQPFILRRLKNDVLTELPARTEVTLHVELSAEERTLYEALRRNAMQTMNQSQQTSAPAGQRHLKVLAEIMKLRRACCHPRLVIEDSDISSAKLQVFEELVDELISNRHKALVFSQFVTHLSLLKELLDKKDISYQYLDGSTTMKQRKKAVDAFQAGQGDLFLISLKAGGSGLNLTAADYVVHMDPWWNPAVEDQASDRAHRIGQKRPVTIYRLVAKDTIEDKIVELHRHKRDLANSLLEGGDVSGKMSVQDMLELIQAID